MKSISNHEVKILDCSLRDGGYYNNWKFDIKNANNYLEQIYNSNIKLVEIGFHFFDKNADYGKFAYADEKLFQQLKINKNTQFAIMINASDLLKKGVNVKKKLNLIFKAKSKSRNISIVRIAAHYKDIFKIKEYIKVLKKKGLIVCLNLMQINTVTDKKLISCLKKLRKWNIIDVFYFADSFGNLNPKNVKNLCLLIKKYWKNEFGIHSHDNCAKALINSITAFKYGATWIDGTVQGMGRGAGNVKTEGLLKYFENYNYKPNAINNISKGYFQKLKKRYKWGPSKNYNYAAKFNIHPSYIQELCKDERYNSKEINKIIINLSKINAKSFDPKFLSEPSILKNKNKSLWNAFNWCSKRVILLLGSGPSLNNKKNIKRLEKYILNYKPLVLSININKYVSEKMIDYYVTCNEPRVLVDHPNYKNLKKTIILPLNILKSFTKIKQFNNILNYGVKLINNKFKCYNNYTILPSNLSFGYAVSLSIIGGASKLMLAGFDGHQRGHNLNLEVDKILRLSKKNYSFLPINTLTKSTHRIK